MKTVKKSFKSVSFATLIFCAAATTAIAGQHSFSGNANRGAGHSGSVRYNNSQQVQTNQNGASGRYQVGYTGRNHGANAQVQTNHTGASGRYQAGYAGAQAGRNHGGNGQVQANHAGTSGRIQAGRNHGGNGQVQANHAGTSGRTQAGANRQTRGNRRSQVFGF